MGLKMYMVILALLHAGIAVGAFQITAFDPRTNPNSGVKKDEGDDIDLWCKTDDYWEWCKIRGAIQ